MSNLLKALYNRALAPQNSASSEEPRYLTGNTPRGMKGKAPEHSTRNQLYPSRPRALPTEPSNSKSSSKRFFNPKSLTKIGRAIEDSTDTFPVFQKTIGTQTDEPASTVKIKQARTERDQFLSNHIKKREKAEKEQSNRLQAREVRAACIKAANERPEHRVGINQIIDGTFVAFYRGNEINGRVGAINGGADGAEASLNRVFRANHDFYHHTFEKAAEDFLNSFPNSQVAIRAKDLPNSSRSPANIGQSSSGNPIITAAAAWAALNAIHTSDPSDPLLAIRGITAGAFAAISEGFQTGSREEILRNANIGATAGVAAALLRRPNTLQLLDELSDALSKKIPSETNRWESVSPQKGEFASKLVEMAGRGIARVVCDVVEAKGRQDSFFFSNSKSTSNKIANIAQPPSSYVAANTGVQVNDSSSSQRSISTSETNSLCDATSDASSEEGNGTQGKTQPASPHNDARATIGLTTKNLAAHNQNQINEATSSNTSSSRAHSISSAVTLPRNVDKSRRAVSTSDGGYPGGQEQVLGTTSDFTYSETSSENSTTSRNEVTGGRNLDNNYVSGNSSDSTSSNISDDDARLCTAEQTSPLLALRTNSTMRLRSPRGINSARPGVSPNIDARPANLDRINTSSMSPRASSPGSGHLEQSITGSVSPRASSPYSGLTDSENTSRAGTPEPRSLLLPFSVIPVRTRYGNFSAQERLQRENSVESASESLLSENPTSANYFVQAAPRYPANITREDLERFDKDMPGSGAGSQEVNGYEGYGELISFLSTSTISPPLGGTLGTGIEPANAADIPSFRATAQTTQVDANNETGSPRAVAAGLEHVETEGENNGVDTDTTSNNGSDADDMAAANIPSFGATAQTTQVNANNETGSPRAVAAGLEHVETEGENNGVDTDTTSNNGSDADDMAAANIPSFGATAQTAQVNANNETGSPRAVAAGLERVETEGENNGVDAGSRSIPTNQQANNNAQQTATQFQLTDYREYKRKTSAAADKQMQTFLNEHRGFPKIPLEGTLNSGKPSDEAITTGVKKLFRKADVAIQDNNSEAEINFIVSVLMAVTGIYTGDDLSDSAKDLHTKQGMHLHQLEAESVLMQVNENRGKDTPKGRILHSGPLNEPEVNVDRLDPISNGENIREILKIIGDKHGVIPQVTIYGVSENGKNLKFANKLTPIKLGPSIEVDDKEKIDKVEISILLLDKKFRPLTRDMSLRNDMLEYKERYKAKSTGDKLISLAADLFDRSRIKARNLTVEQLELFGKDEADVRLHKEIIKEGEKRIGLQKVHDGRLRLTNAGSNLAEFGVEALTEVIHDPKSRLSKAEKNRYKTALKIKVVEEDNKARPVPTPLIIATPEHVGEIVGMFTEIRSRHEVLSLATTDNSKIEESRKAVTEAYLLFEESIREGDLNKLDKVIIKLEALHKQSAADENERVVSSEKIAEKVKAFDYEPYRQELINQNFLRLLSIINVQKTIKDILPATDKLLAKESKLKNLPNNDEDFVYQTGLTSLRFLRDDKFRVNLKRDIDYNDLISRKRDFDLYENHYEKIVEAAKLLNPLVRPN